MWENKDQKISEYGHSLHSVSNESILRWINLIIFYIHFKWKESITLYLFIYLFICLFIYLFIRLFIYLFIYLFLYLLIFSLYLRLVYT